MSKKYASYNGKIAEALIEVFLQKHDYLVQRYGVEHHLGIATNLIEPSNCKNDNAKKVMSKYMTMPDFVVMKLNKQNSIENIFFVDVKYKEFTNIDDFKSSLKKDGHIYEQALKYKNLWDGVVFILLIAKIEGKIYLYYGSVNKITDYSFIDKLEKKTNFWLNQEYLDELLSKAEKFYQ